MEKQTLKHIAQEELLKDWHYQQDRLSRWKLIGRGIVCGLEAWQDSICHIHLSGGKGVSSEGHLICLEEDMVFRYYGRFWDEQGYFQHWFDEMPVIYELFTQPGENTWPLTPQKIGEVEYNGKEQYVQVEQTPSILDPAEYVLVLWLEKLKPSHLRFLLLHQRDAWRMMEKNGELADFCLLEDIERTEAPLHLFDKEKKALTEQEAYYALHKHLMLDDISMRRFSYGGIDLDDNELEPNKAYHFISQSSFEGVYKAFEVLVDEVLPKLDAGLGKLHEHAGEVFGHRSVCYLDAFFRRFCLCWEQYKAEKAPHYSIQYLYCFVKDLLEAYNELREKLCRYQAVCCPDPRHFPRHLFLGKPLQEIGFQPGIFRHGFSQPPIFNDEARLLREIRMQHWRMTLMLKSFCLPTPDNQDFPDVAFDDPSDDAVADLLKRTMDEWPAIDEWPEVRITPSRPAGFPLGKRAIPFYFHLSNSPYSLHHVWDFDAAGCNEADHHFSYHASWEKNSYTGRHECIFPFAFFLKDHNFYRIEGHLGRHLLDDVTEDGTEMAGVLPALIESQRLHNISFGILAITVEEVFDFFNGLNKGANTAGLPPQTLRLLEKVGMDPKCGVMEGGTLVLVCKEETLTTDAGEKITKSIVVADFCLPYYCCTPEKPLPPLTPVKGRVFSCRYIGLSVAGAQVEIGGQVAITDNDGTFTIGLIPGEYILKISKEGFTAHTEIVEVYPGMPGLNIPLKPEISQIALEVLEFGQAVTDATITLKDTGENVVTNRIGNHYTLELPAGPQTVVIDTPANDTDVELGFTVDPCTFAKYEIDIIEQMGPQARLGLLLSFTGFDPTAEPDKLSEIEGIGNIIEGILNSMNITTYRQLSKLEGKLAILGQIDPRLRRAVRDDWAGQAKRLLAENDTENE